MSKVDWSLAPEGATHYNKNNNMFYVFCGDHFKFFCNDGELSYGGLPGEYLAMEKRPKQPQSWSGPEDGLPPLGIEVDFDYRGCPQGSGKVLFYGNEFCIVQNTTGGAPYEQVALIEDYSFKCLHDAGELATKQRESAIRELMDIAQVDCRVTAARLVDAGFKREGV